MQYKVSGLIKAGIILNLIPQVIISIVCIFCGLEGILISSIIVIFIILHVRIFKGEASNGIRIFIGVMSCTSFYGILSGIFILAGKYKEKNSTQREFQTYNRVKKIYDEQGNLIKKIKYYIDGQIHFIEEYYSDGSIKLIEEYNHDGTLKDKKIFS